MKVLQLCNKPPKPEVDGGCIAMSNISEGLLAQGIELKILTVSTEKHPFEIEKINPEFVKSTQIEGIFLDTRINVIDAFSALVTADSYNVNRFFSPDFDKRLRELLQEDFDIIHLESLFMTPYISTIRQCCSAKIVLRSHNLEHLIWERLANSTGNKAKKMYLKHLASKLKKYEKRTINEVDGIAAISKEDTDRFLAFDCNKPLITIPFGIDLDDYKIVASERKERNKLFHIGAMNWEPNREAMNWFSDEIWPLIKKEDLSFHMAGRYMSADFEKLASDNFKVHGEVDSVHDFMNDHDIMIVPLLSGSGMRIKIIEGMAMGKTVISTSVGAEGINCQHNKTIIIADTAKEFATAIKELIKDQSKVDRIGKAARKLVEEEYDNANIIKKLLEFYNS
ncbi:MAG: glycosyltransferase family 4 protein [Crocinitomicaceae bacterium]